MRLPGNQSVTQLEYKKEEQKTGAKELSTRNGTTEVRYCIRDHGQPAYLWRLQ